MSGDGGTVFRVVVLAVCFPIYLALLMCVTVLPMVLLFTRVHPLAAIAFAAGVFVLTIPLENIAKGKGVI